jgi:hypothetical protein
MWKINKFFDPHTDKELTIVNVGAVDENCPEITLDFDDVDHEYTQQFALDLVVLMNKNLFYRKP